MSEQQTDMRKFSSVARETRLPKGAKVESVRRVGEGYEISYSVPGRERRFHREEAGLRAFHHAEREQERAGWVKQAQRTRPSELGLVRYKLGEWAAREAATKQMQEYLITTAGPEGTYTREQVMGFSEEKLRSEYLFLSGAAEPVTLEDLITMASMVTVAYGYARLVKVFVAPKIVSAAKGAWKGSRIESWLLRQSDWYAKRAATGILSPQVVATQQLPKEAMLSYGEMKAVEQAWQLGLTPKTSLAIISKTPETVAHMKVLPHGFFRAGKFTSGYLAELAFSKTVYGGLISEQPITTEAVKYPALQRLPYAPTFEGAIQTSQALIPFFMLPPVPTVTPKTVEKQKRKTEVATTTLSRVFSRTEAMPQALTREALIPTSALESRLRVAPIQKTAVLQKSVLKQKVVQKQVLRQAAAYSKWLRTVTSKPRVEEPSFYKPSKPRKKRARKGFLWRYRVHAVREPTDILQSLRDMVGTK